MQDFGDALPFDLRALEVFLAVCDAGTMVGAARRLRLTQPAVSQGIAELETRSGVVLLDRAVRPLGLTAAGVMLRERARALLAEARQIAPLLRQTTAGRLHSVRVGLVDSLSRAVMATLATHVAGIAAEATFLSGLTATHASALLTRQLDLVLGVDDLGDIGGLERWPIIREPYVLLCPPDLPAPASIDALAELSRHLPLVRYSSRSRTGLEIERHLHRLRLDIPRGQEFDTPHGVTSVVAAARGWAVTTPLCLYEAAAEPGAFACHPLPGPRLQRRLTLIARARELGRVPRDMAGITRQALFETCIPSIVEAVPWLRSEIAVES